MEANKPSATYVEDVREDNSKDLLDYEKNSDSGKVNIHAESQGHDAMEKALTLRQAVKIYPKAILWSIAISLAVIMESYDLQIVSSFFAYPSFQKKYGVPNPAVKGAYVIPAKWQVALGTGSTIGMIIGIGIGGILVDKYGHKRVVLAGLAFNIATIFITFFAVNIEMLLAGEVISGLPWGMFSTAAPAYAAEVCPMVLRGYMTIWVNLCWVIGHILGAGILRALVSNTTEWSYRIPFALQWMFPVPLIAICAWAPSSPWWLVRKGRIEEAERNYARVVSSAFLPGGATPMVDPARAVSHMIETVNLEKELQIGATYSALFKGTNLRRTEIASIAWISQSLVGFGIQGYNIYFFVVAGLPSSQSYALGLGAFCIAFAGTASSWILISYFGRRTIFLTGVLAMIPVMSLIGFLDLAHKTSGVKWAQAAMLLTWFALYGLTIGPVPYVIASETGAVRLRMKTIAFARGIYYVFVVANTVVAPYMFTQTAWNLGGKGAFPAAVFQVLLLVWGFFRLPEMKGRTFEELDVLFVKKVPARKFKGYKVTEEDILAIHSEDRN